MKSKTNQKTLILNLKSYQLYLLKKSHNLNKIFNQNKINKNMNKTLMNSMIWNPKKWTLPWWVTNLNQPNILISLKGKLSIKTLLMSIKTSNILKKFMINHKNKVSNFKLNNFIEESHLNRMNLLNIKSKNKNNKKNQTLTNLMKWNLKKWTHQWWATINLNQKKLKIIFVYLKEYQNIRT